MPDNNHDDEYVARKSSEVDNEDFARRVRSHDDTSQGYGSQNNTNIDDDEDEIKSSELAMIGGGAFIGAIIGAVIGTVILPGVGTVLGLTVGIFVGFVVGAVINHTLPQENSAESRDNSEARQSNSEVEGNASEFRESIDLSYDNQRESEVYIDVGSDSDLEDIATTEHIISNKNGPSLKQLSSHSNSEENSNEESNRASYNNPN